MKSHRVVHHYAMVDGANFAAGLLAHLNSIKHRGRVNDSGEISLVWEVSDMDQLDAFLREQAQKMLSGAEKTG